MNKNIIIGIIAAAVLIPVGAYTASPLFYNRVVNEVTPSDMQSTLMHDAMGKTLPSGTFVVQKDGIHDVTGTAKIVQDKSGAKFLRFENFHSTNGPDLYVYLATDDKASDYVTLEKLKGNIGDQNYQIPDNVDLAKYNKVLIWCKQFSVLFGSASLA